MKRVSRVYLIRHGQVNDFEYTPVYGHTDVDLTAVGVLQMQQVAERLRLADIKTVYSSDLQRAAKGARLVASYHDAPVRLLSELREMYFGEWEGLTLEKIREKYSEELKARERDLVNFEIPGEGESVSRFAKRITSCYNNIIEQEIGNDIALVAHAGVNRVIICSALRIDATRMFNFHQSYGCLNIIDYFPDSTSVRLVNG